MKKIYALALAATAPLALLSSPALAQDMVDDAPFTGVYVGGSFGYDVQPNDVGETIEFDRNLNGSFNDTVLTGTGANAFGQSVAQPGAGFCNGAATSTGKLTGCRNDKDDIGYAVRVGADHQYGNIVVGVVGEFGKTEITDSVTAFSVTPANYVFTREVDWEASVRGRLGFAANKTLFYGAFGVGYAKIANSFSSSQSVNTFTGSGDEKEFGILGGGGIEQKIGDNFSIGLEYMFHRYEDRDYRVRTTGAAGTPFTNTTNGGVAGGTDFRRNFDYFRWHSLRATAAFRF